MNSVIQLFSVILAFATYTIRSRYTWTHSHTAHRLLFTSWFLEFCRNLGPTKLVYTAHGMEGVCDSISRGSMWCIKAVDGGEVEM